MDVWQPSGQIRSKSSVRILHSRCLTMRRIKSAWQILTTPAFLNDPGLQQRLYISSVVAEFIKDSPRGRTEFLGRSWCIDRSGFWANRTGVKLGDNMSARMMFED